MQINPLLIDSWIHHECSLLVIVVVWEGKKFPGPPRRLVTSLCTRQVVSFLLLHTSNTTWLMESIMGRSVFTATFLLSCLIGFVAPREEEGHGGGSCGTHADVRIQANYRPGVITLDGRADDWAQVDAFDFSLLPALHPDAGDSYRHGKMTVKVFPLLIPPTTVSFSVSSKDWFFIVIWSLLAGFTWRPGGFLPAASRWSLFIL